MNQAIISAIQDKQVLSIWYNGGARLIEPHCYGLSNAGNELLRCYQISGHSVSGQHEGWKLMTVEGIQNINPSGDTFIGPRPHYNPISDKHIPTVYAKI